MYATRTGRAGDLVAAQRDDKEAIGPPEPVSVVAGVDGDGGLPVCVCFDEASLWDQPERYFSQERGCLLPSVPDCGQRRHGDPHVVGEQSHHGVDFVCDEGLASRCAVVCSVAVPGRA
jgi:hypothetical protein